MVFVVCCVCLRARLSSATTTGWLLRRRMIPSPPKNLCSASSEANTSTPIAGKNRRGVISVFRRADGCVCVKANRTFVYPHQPTWRRIEFTFSNMCEWAQGRRTAISHIHRVLLHVSNTLSLCALSAPSASLCGPGKPSISKMWQARCVGIDLVHLGRTRRLLLRSEECQAPQPVNNRGKAKARRSQEPS